MLRGQLSAEMNWDDLQTAAGMTLLAYRHAIVLNNLHLPLPIEVIGELSPFLKPAQFSGNLLLESPQLTFIDNHLQGSATAHWNQAGSAMSAVHPLGDYQIEMTANQNSLSATLSTRAGVLQLSGQGNWSPAQKFHFNGTASATPESNGALTELLHHLGPELSPGVYRIFL
jgi:general secretion pathway protein N